MLIVGLELIRKFAQQHANSRKSLATWKSDVENAVWNCKQDVLKDFPKAKMIADIRARFEILHNTYRLIIKINYLDQVVRVRFIGTHNEYDRIDPTAV